MLISVKEAYTVDLFDQCIILYMWLAQAFVNFQRKQRNSNCVVFSEFQAMSVITVSFVFATVNVNLSEVWKMFVIFCTSNFLIV